MTYGINMKNSDGVDALDDTNKCLVVKYAGTTTLNYLDINNLPWQIATARWDVMMSPSYGATPTGMTWRWGGTNGDVIIMEPNVPANASPQDTTFYQISYADRISASCENVYEHHIFPWSASIGAVTRAGVPFKTVGPISDSDGDGSAYGMRVFNAGSEKVFDSTADFLAIRYAFILSAATMFDLLTDDAPVDVTLPESMPDCWIAAPIYAPKAKIWKSNTATYAYFDMVDVEFWQHDATTIRFQRVTTESRQAHTANPQFWEYAHDAIFYVARSV